MVVLQVYQAKLLRGMDESGPDLTAFKDLRSTTNLALCATKMTAQAIGRSMASLVVLECYLWLTLTEIEVVDNVCLPDLQRRKRKGPSLTPKTSPQATSFLSPSTLFGSR
ncbi:hypothetical protein M9458_057539, partial [Cirrhinus mrigala]